MKYFMNICLLLLLNAALCSYAEAINLSEYSIIIPNRIGPIEVDKSNYDDVIKLLGTPEAMEDNITKLSKEKILDLKYPRLGMDFTILRDKGMEVVRIEVYKPFSGKSSEGLYIDMPITRAINLITSKYGKPKIDLKDVGYVDWEIPNTFALKHQNGRVTAVKMLGMTE